MPRWYFKHSRCSLTWAKVNASKCRDRRKNGRPLGKLFVACFARLRFLKNRLPGRGTGGERVNPGAARTEKLVYKFSRTARLPDRWIRRSTGYRYPSSFPIHSERTFQPEYLKPIRRNIFINLTFENYPCRSIAKALKRVSSSLAANHPVSSLSSR